MSNHQYLNTFVNNSSTISEKVGENIENIAYKAVMYNSDGNIVVATDGNTAVGVALGDSPDNVTKNDNIDFIIKDIGLIEAGSSIAKGDALSINSKGQAVKAETGSFIFGLAFSAGEENQLIQIQINKAGKMV